MTPSSNRGISRPTQRALASAGAVSLVVASLSAMPASFANEQQPAPHDNSSGCRNIAITADRYQGLPGEYQLAYSDYTRNLYTTFSNGRPPVYTGGVGVWTTYGEIPTLDEVMLPGTVDFVPSGQTEATSKQLASPDGIAIDDAHGTIWVTQTRTNSVTVYDLYTKKELWTSYDAQNPENGAVSRPREVKVDAKSGKAFVSGSGGVTVFDLKSHQVIQKINFTRSDGSADTGMNMELDSEGGRLYVPSLNSGTLKVINTETLAVEQTIELHKEVADAQLRPSDVTIDKSLGEIYVSSQGDMDRETKVSKGNSGVTVYDLKTGEYKKSINFGKQTLAVTADEEHDVVYATDFATGKIGVIDGRTGSITHEVSTGAEGGANDVLVTPEGEVYAVVRDKFADNVTTGYTLDPTTGKFKEAASTEPKGENGADTPIVVNSLVKITPTFTPVPNIPQCDPVQTQQVVATTSTAGVVYPRGTSTAPSQTSNGDTPVFSDVPEGYPFYADIQWLAHQRLSFGWADGTYHPQQPVDRGAMAAYFYRMAGSPEVALPETSPFKDVDSSHPFYKEIVWMSQQGITTGYEDGSYRPNASVNRGAMAAFFFRYAKVTNYEAPQTPQFKDVDRNNPFYREISWFKDQHITTGWGDGTFRPNEPIQRAAMAAFIHRFAVK